jgi:hypothetical protein
MKGRSIILGAALILGPMLAACLSHTASAQARPPDSRQPLNTIKDVGDALSRCWVPPSLEKSRSGTQITVQITFNRSGEVMGEPRFTFITPGTPPEIRTAYQLSVADAISRCAPMPFTPALGGALAGRPFAMRYQDTRGQKGADKSWLITKTG